MLATWIFDASTSWTFWDVLVLLLALYPLSLLWTISVVDLFHRTGLERWELGVWLLAIVAVPLFGAMLYLIIRPGIEPSSHHMFALDSEKPALVPQPLTRAGQLYILADLHDAGKLTDGEFAAAKVRVLRDDVGISRS